MSASAGAESNASLFAIAEALQYMWRAATNIGRKSVNLIKFAHAFCIE